MRNLNPWLVASFLSVGLYGCSQSDNGQVARLQQELKTAKEEASAAQAELAKLKETTKLTNPGYTIPPEALVPGGTTIPPAPAPPAPTIPPPKPEPVPVAPPTPVATGNDEELIQGDWETGSGSSFVEGVQIIIAGNKDLGYLMSIGGDKCSYKIDATKSPKTIDITSARDGRTMLGIYELKGGILTMAVLLNGSVRPDNYAMTAEDTANDKAGKSSKWVFVLTRQRR